MESGAETEKVGSPGQPPDLFQFPVLLLEVIEAAGHTKGSHSQVVAGPALSPHKHRLLWPWVPMRSRGEGPPCSLMMGPGLQHTVASGTRMLTQAHVASSCGLVSVARARKGEGGCSTGTHSICPCFIARHVASFLLSRAMKRKLFGLGRLCFSLTLSQGPLLLEIGFCTRSQVAPALG